MFAFMPYMHTENINYQKKGYGYFQNHMDLYEGTGGKRKPVPILKYMTKTQNQKDYEMLKNMRIHMKGHHDTILAFGRFPKRNKALGRESTPQELTYMKSPEVQKRPY